MSSEHHDVRPPPFDAFVPREMARRAEEVGIRKVATPAGETFVLAVLAGAFIAMGAVFATTVTAGAEPLHFGMRRLLGGASFCLGLILVVVAGAELFTGNNLIVMAAANRKVSLKQLLWNWSVVYAGNLVGAVATAVIVCGSGHHAMGSGVVGANALRIAAAKCQLGFVEAVLLGVLCNALVCLAVWLCFSARSTTDKILSVFLPITAFVAAGFEHSVANMYFIPAALFLQSGLFGVDPASFGVAPSELGGLTWMNFFWANLLPVTLGNVIGGAALVGVVYWFVYLRKRD